MNNFSLNDVIESKLLEQRKIFLWGQVEDRSAKYIVDRLLYLNALDKTKEIQFIINSPGGYVTSGFSIYDTMKAIESPVSTICSGFAASMGSILLSGGTKGRRFILPNARVMIHQPNGGAQGSSADIEIQMNEIIKTKALGAKIIADNCGQDFEKVMKDMNRDHWMNSQESIDYGIVDGIIESI